MAVRGTRRISFPQSYHENGQTEDDFVVAGGASGRAERRRHATRSCTRGCPLLPRGGESSGRDEGGEGIDRWRAARKKGGNAGRMCVDD